MVDSSANMLLYIEPQGQKSDQPAIDDLTKKMTAAFKDYRTGSGSQGQFMEDVMTMGHQTCACGAQSTNVDYDELGNVSNSCLEMQEAFKDFL